MIRTGDFANGNFMSLGILLVTEEIVVADISQEAESVCLFRKYPSGKLFVRDLTALDVYPLQFLSV
jgi:hypothetical protein